jgi:NAD(P)H-quinone oxidoreductase subunit 2
MIISWLFGTNQIRWFYFSSFLTFSYKTKVERIEKVSHSQPLMKDPSKSKDWVVHFQNHQPHNLSFLSLLAFTNRSLLSFSL